MRTGFCCGWAVCADINYAFVVDNYDELMNHDDIDDVDDDVLLVFVDALLIILLSTLTYILFNMVRSFMN